MAFADVEAKTTIDPAFSAADRAAIIDAMRDLYDGSATARKMFDDWIAVSGNTLQVDFGMSAFRGFFNTGRIEIDPSYLNDKNYIDDNGKAIEYPLIGAIAHEFVHAITGLRDNTNSILDYAGDTVRFTNDMHDELGIPRRNSYFGFGDDAILTPGFEYTNGAEIDRSVSADRDWNSSLALLSDDLLVGGPSANRLESGLGDDFLFGGGGNDFLNGGLFGTDTAVLTGKPVDYDIRLNADGTWTSRHVRGTKDEGTDTFKNLEQVQFEGGKTFGLKENGLTFQNDFAFVVDQTGSMFDDIDAVKASATAIIDALFAGDTADARVGVVGFRDNTIGEPTQVVLPFTDQDNFADRKAAALAAINSLGASGGGDFAETAFDGLLKALDGSMGEWREGAGTKRVALFTDASAKDAFLAPTVLGFALDIGAVISASSSEPLGSFGSVDTFELSFEGSANLDPSSEGDVLPPFVPSDDPIQPPGGTATVQIFTIFVETFIAPDPNLVEISESSGGGVLTAANPEEVVERLLEVISGLENAPPVAADDAFNVNEDSSVSGNVLDNDADPDAGDTLAVSLVSGPAEGTLNLNADGSFTYEADADAFDIATPGTENEQTFTYEVSDGNGGMDQATVTITVAILDDGETITGTNKPDDLAGTDGGEDIITGGNAKDILAGLDGADELHGDDGDDTLFGGESIDHLFGGRGNDLLDGGEGDDLLHGGQGDDTLTGGLGADEFWIEKSGGTETITDFVIGEDLIRVSGIKQVGSFDDIGITQSGADAVLDFKGALAILEDTDASLLDADDVHIG